MKKNNIYAKIKEIIEKCNTKEKNLNIIRLFDLYSKVNNQRNESADLILLTNMDKIYHYGLFGAIITHIKEMKEYRVEQYVPRCFIIGETKNILILLLTRILSPFHVKRWINNYNAYCDKVGYKNNTIKPFYDLIDSIKALKLWLNILKDNKIKNIIIENINFSDLVIDTYLRFKPSAKLEIRNIYFYFVLWQMYRNFRRAELYFKNKKPKYFITAYGTYIDFGIAVRVAIKNGVKVIAFGDTRGFIKELNYENWFHTRTTDQYSKIFDQLENKSELLSKAEHALKYRFSGGIDDATKYMRKSAYQLNNEYIPDVKNSLVIFLHDFYDSPHGHKYMLFNDFWEWICYTIERLTEYNINYFIKPHPNQIPLNETIIKELKRKYKNIKLISSSISNTQLVMSGMKCGVTVYGTVAHEIGYFGIPVICCGDNPHNSYDFYFNAKNLNEYDNYLKNSMNLEKNKEYMRLQCLSFYYMHNIHIKEEIKEIRDYCGHIMNNCNKKSDYPEISNDFKILKNMKSFQKIIYEMVS